MFEMFGNGIFDRDERTELAFDECKARRWRDLLDGCNEEFSSLGITTCEIYLGGIVVGDGEDGLFAYTTCS